MARLFTFLLFWLAPVARAQLAPERWVDELYGPMEQVLLQVEALPEVVSGQTEAFDAFIRSDALTTAYFEAFLTTPMGAPFRNQQWVRESFRIISLQWRALARSLPTEAKRRLWTRTATSAGVVSGSSAHPDQARMQWRTASDDERGGAEFWFERRRRIRTVLRDSADPAPQTTMRVHLSEGIVAMRARSPIAALDLLKGDALAMFRTAVSPEDLIEFDRLADPSLLPSTLNRIVHRWVVQLTARYRSILLAENVTASGSNVPSEAEIRALSDAVVRSVREEIQWPTVAELSSWTITSNGRPEEWRVFRLPRLLYAAMTEGISATECSSGGMPDAAQMIHPEDYALPSLPDAQAAVLISHDARAGTLRFRGTANLYRLENSGQPGKLFSFHSRFQNQTAERMQSVMEALFELTGVDALVIEGNMTRVDNSGWSKMLRAKNLQAQMMIGRRRLFGAASLLQTIRRLTQEGILTPPDEYRLIGAGIAAGTVPDTRFVLKLDRATLARTDFLAQQDFVGQWLAEMEHGYRTKQLTDVAQEIVERLQKLAIAFPDSRGTVARIIALLASRTSLFDMIQASFQRAAGELIRASSGTLSTPLLPVLLQPLLLNGNRMVQTAAEQLLDALSTLGASERTSALAALRAVYPWVSEALLATRIADTLRLHGVAVEASSSASASRTHPQLITARDVVLGALRESRRTAARCVAIVVESISNGRRRIP